MKIRSQKKYARELRRAVSQYGDEIYTAKPISGKRLRRIIYELRGNLSWRAVHYNENRFDKFMSFVLWPGEERDCIYWLLERFRFNAKRKYTVWVDLHDEGDCDHDDPWYGFTQT